MWFKIKKYIRARRYDLYRLINLTLRIAFAAMVFRLIWQIPLPF